MSLKSLFSIILKVLGLFFLRDFLSSIPSFFSLLSILLGYSDGGAILPVIGGLIVISIFGCAAYALLFQTEWIIEKLHLADGFDEEDFTFNIHRSTVLSIAVIVVGALMIVNTIPLFSRQVFLFFQEEKNGMFNAYPKTDKTLLIVYVVQIIIGLLLLGNVQKVVSYIDLKRRKTSMIEEFSFEEMENDESQTTNDTKEAN